MLLATTTPTTASSQYDNNTKPVLKPSLDLNQENTIHQRKVILASKPRDWLEKHMTLNNIDELREMILV